MEISNLHFFKWVSNGVAIIPGLLILKNELPIPPDFSRGLMAGLQEITCCFIVAFAWINGKSVTKLSRKAFNRYSIIFFSLFIFFVFLYMYVLDLSVINSPEWGKSMFVPLWSNNEINREGGFQKYYDTYGVDELTYLLATNFKTSLVLSKILIYINFLLIFICLTLTFTFLWLKYQSIANRKTVKSRREG